LIALAIGCSVYVQDCAETDESAYFGYFVVVDDLDSSIEEEFRAIIGDSGIPIRFDGGYEKKDGYFLDADTGEPVKVLKPEVKQIGEDSCIVIVKWYSSVMAGGARPYRLKLENDHWLLEKRLKEFIY